MKIPKKRIFAIFTSIILIAILAVSMVGCGGPEEAEAKAIVKDLVESSLELNEIYFGKKGLNYRDSGNPAETYLPVLETEKYVFKSKLVEATYKVFCEDYADSIIKMAFSGAQSEINQNSVKSRFMLIGDDDWLYINKDYEYPIEHFTEYDFSTIKIDYISGSFIDATIEGKRMTDKGYENVTVDISLVNEDNGWRLQDATY